MKIPLKTTSLKEIIILCDKLGLNTDDVKITSEIWTNTSNEDVLKLFLSCDNLSKRQRDNIRNITGKLNNQ